MGERIFPLIKISPFVGRIREQKTFRERLVVCTLPAPIYSVTGAGGIGKSTLFAQFERICREDGFVTLKVNLEECRSSIELLTAATSTQQHAVPLERLRTSQCRLAQIWNTVAKKERILPDLLKDFSGSAIGSALGGVVGGPPGVLVGALAGAVVGKLTKDVADSTIHTFAQAGISTDDALFAMDPERALTNAFIEDVNLFAEDGRIVLMFDGYDVPRRWNRWILETLLTPNGIKPEIPVAISGKDLLGIEWRKLDREIVEFPLRELFPQEAASLARELGITSETEVAKIVEESHRIPWKIELLSEAYLAGHLAPNETLPSDASNHLFVERALSHLDERQRTIVEAATVLRQFDQDRLAALLPQNIESKEFSELLQMGFIDRETSGLWSVSDPVRKEILRGLQQRAPDRFIRYQLAAADFFRSKMITSSAELRTSAAANSVYHALRCDQPQRLNIILEIFSTAVWPPDLATCDAIVAEVNLEAAQIDSAGCLLQYLEARALGLRSRWVDARSKLSDLTKDAQQCSPQLLGLALEHLGWINLYQGELEAALKAFGKAYETFITLGASDEIQLLLNKLGKANRRLGRWDLARTYHELVIAEKPTAKTAKPAHIEAYRCLSRLWRDRGEWKTAIDACEKSIEFARAAKQTFDEALGLARVAELYCAEGRWNDAEIACNAAFPILLASRNDLAIGSAYHNSGRIAMWRDAHDDCLSNYVTALFYYRRFAANVGVVLLYLDLSRFWILQRQFDRALRYVEDATQLAVDIGDTLPIASCNYLRGEIARITGKLEVSQDSLARALVGFERAENVHGIRETLLSLVPCVWKSRDPDYRKMRKRLNDLLWTETSDYLLLRFQLVGALLSSKSPPSKASRDKVAKVIQEAQRYSPALGRNFTEETRLVWNQQQSNKRYESTPSSDSADNYVLCPGGELKQRNPPNKSPQLCGTFITAHHGLTKLRAEGRIQGRIDSSLVPETRESASRLAQAITKEFTARDVNLSTISLHSAPARRTYETAFAVATELIAKGAADIQIRIWMALDNICFGEWEGRLKSEVAAVTEYTRISSGFDFGAQAPGLSPDGIRGERVIDVLRRTICAVRSIARQTENAIVVGHRISLLLPATLLWAPSLLTDEEKRINWRALRVKAGGYIVFGAQGAKIDADNLDD